MASAIVMDLMSLKELCDHLNYSRQVDLPIELERLDRLTRSAVSRYKNEASNFPEIRNKFLTFHNLFVTHLRKETEEFFPFIRQWLASDQEALSLRSSLQTWISEFREEHSRSDETLAELQAFIRKQPINPSTSQTARLIAQSVDRLDKLLQEQIYKENQMLFPRILAFGKTG